MMLALQGAPLSGIILSAGNGCFSELHRLEEFFNLQWAAPAGLVPPQLLADPPAVPAYITFLLAVVRVH
jgi:hypothetical protein